MQHLQHIMLYYFKKGKNATEMQKEKICAVYGEGAVTVGICQSGSRSFVLEISRWTVLCSTCAGSHSDISSVTWPTAIVRHH